MTPREQKGYTFFLSVGLIFAGLFAYWWFQPEHITGYFSGSYRILDVLLFIALTFVMWQRIGMDISGWLIGRKIVDPKQRTPEPGKKVAFITNFVPGSEPIEMLRKTLSAMKKVAYKHDTWVLDEGNDPAARALAEELGIKYFTRNGIAKYNTKGGKYAAKTKGGNHNSWYAEHGHSYDYVAQIDTDFIPEKNFLTATIGQFRDPKVAFVGTPQIYGNTNESWIARGAAQQTYTFYGPIMRGLSSRDSTMMIGANHIVRVKALKDIGFYSAHVTEDLLTGMTLHHNGWKSVYIPKALAIGEGPSTWKAFFSQQTRWAFGCIDVLFNHFPELMRNMSAQRMLYYLWMQQFYFNGLAFVVGLALITMYFTTGYQPGNISLIEIIVWGAPLYFWRQIFTLWRNRFNIRPDEERGIMTAGRLITLAVMPIYFMAFLKVIQGTHLGFKVTPKGSKQKKASSSNAFLPHFALGLISVAGLLTGIILGHDSVVFLAWGILNSVTLLSFFMYYKLAEIGGAIARPFKRGIVEDAETVTANN